MMDYSIDVMDIQERIITLRGVQVMLDRDLAELYGVQTKRLNEQVKRNAARFPRDYSLHYPTQRPRNWSQNATGSRR